MNSYVAPSRATTSKRAALWVIEKLATVRKTVIQRAGRLTQPHGIHTLTMSAGSSAKPRLLRTLAALETDA
jgi:hypothetical protein